MDRKVGFRCSPRLHSRLLRLVSDSFKTAFSEVGQRFIADSSPVASVSALCNTAAGLRAVSTQ
jgi:hypothetical protein